MDGWLSKDIERLESIQDKYCKDSNCIMCYFNNRAGCLAEVVMDVRTSYNYLDQVFTKCVNQIKEHF